MSTRIFTWNGQRPLIVPKGCDVLISEGTRVRQIDAPGKLTVPTGCRVMNREMLRDACEQAQCGNFYNVLALAIFGGEP